MMFECPHCKTLNAVKGFNLDDLCDFQAGIIKCSKCERHYAVRKVVEYKVEEVKQ